METHSNLFSELDKILSLLPASSIKTKRESSSFDVTVYESNGNILEEYHGISAAMAGRIRNSNRKLGYRVNQIEVSNLSGDIVRTPFIPPDVHISQCSDKPNVRENHYNARQVKANAKFQQEFFRKANAHLGKISNKNTRILVYEKITSKLCFSGTLENAVMFIIRKMENGDWDETSWVIYLPSKIK